MGTIVEILSSVGLSFVWMNCAWELSQTIATRTINAFGRRPSGAQTTTKRMTSRSAYRLYVAALVGALTVLSVVVLALLYLATTTSGGATIS